MRRSPRLLFALLLSGLVLLGGVWLLYSVQTPEAEPVSETETPEPTPVATSSNPTQIGASVEGRPIQAYSFGNGATDLLFVGGVHGGYEWNSIDLAYRFIDTLTAGSSTIPDTLTVHVIPNLNPDGLYAATKQEGRVDIAAITDHSMHDTGTGRFNANGVDLNRNFACNWAPESSWRGETVSAGTMPFSEPEAVALRDYVYKIEPVAAVFWHSKADAVYASECNEGVLPETLSLMQQYADAANYRAVPSFDAYPITGDMEGWLASLGIPAVTVELGTRTTPEWEQNWQGSQAVFELYK